MNIPIVQPWWYRNRQITWNEVYSEVCSYSKDISKEWKNFIAIISHHYVICSLYKDECVSYQMWHTVNLWCATLTKKCSRTSKQKCLLFPLSVYHHFCYTATINILPLIVLNKQWCYILVWLYKDLIVKLLVSATTFFPVTCGVCFCGILCLFSQNLLYLLW